MRPPDSRRRAVDRPNPGRQAYLAIAAIDALGTGMFLPVSVLFFVQSRHLSPVAVGTALTVASILALLLAPVGAYLIERWGAGRTTVLEYLGKAAGFMAYLFVATAGQFFVAALVTRLVSQWSQPGRLMMASAVARDGQRIGLLATSRALRNVCMSVGSGLAALALLVGPKWAGPVLVGANAASYLLVAGLAARWLPARTAPASTLARTDRRAAGPGWNDVLLRDPSYLLATLVAFLLTLQTPLLMVAFPLTADQVGGYGGAFTAAAITVNTVAIAALQVRFSRDAESTVGAVRSLRRGCWALAGCCLPMALAVPGTPTAVFCLLAMAFVALNTIAELWISAGSWGVALGLAPEDSARHLTIYTSAESFGTALGTGVAVWVLGSLGASGWWAFATVAVLAAALSWTLRRRVTGAVDTMMGVAP